MLECRIRTAVGRSSVTLNIVDRTYSIFDEDDEEWCAPNLGDGWRKIPMWTATASVSSSNNRKKMDDWAAGMDGMFATSQGDNLRIATNNLGDIPGPHPTRTPTTFKSILLDFYDPASFSFPTFFDTFPLPSRALKVQYNSSRAHRTPGFHQLCDPALIRLIRLVPRVTFDCGICSFDKTSGEYLAHLPRFDDADHTIRLGCLRVHAVVPFKKSANPTQSPIALDSFPPISDIANALLNIGGAACRYDIELSSRWRSRPPGTDDTLALLPGMIHQEIQRAITAVRRDRPPGWRKLERGA